MRSFRRRKALAILGRDEERLDHIRLNEVPVEVIELREPEVVTLKVERRFGRVVRVATQVTEVLHKHKGSVEFLLR